MHEFLARVRVDGPPWAGNVAGNAPVRRACLREEGSGRAPGPVGDEADGRLGHRDDRRQSHTLRGNYQRGRNDGRSVAAQGANAAFGARRVFVRSQWRDLIRNRIRCSVLPGSGGMVMRAMIRLPRVHMLWRVVGRDRNRCDRCRGGSLQRNARMDRSAMQHGGRCDSLRRDCQQQQPDQGGTKAIQHDAIINTGLQLQFEGAAQVQSAQVLKPQNTSARTGLKKLRHVGRSSRGGVAKLPPRNTRWSSANQGAEYSV